MQATTATPVTIVVTDPRADRRSKRRFDRWVNQKQSNSVVTATMLFIYGGMELAIGLGWNINTGITSTKQFQYSWFIGVLAGAMLSSLFVTRVPKIVYYGLGAVMNLVSSIIYVSAPYQYVPIIAARYVGGVGIGLITVPFIVHSSEIAARTYRGICSAVEQYGLALGVAIQMIYASQWIYTMDFPANQVHGICGIVLCAMALGSLTLTVESPIFYLRQGQDSNALACQRRLLREFVPIELAENALAEQRLYVQEGQARSVGSELATSLMPFIKLLFFRCFVAFTFSLPLSVVLVSSSLVGEYDTSWPAIVAGVLRMVGALLTLSFVDILGRKFVSLLGLLAIAALMLTIAGIFATPSNLLSSYYMDVVCRCSMAFQFFAGLYVTSTSSYLGEAFAMRVKPLLIALVVAIEQVVHIIVIMTFQYNTESVYEYLLAVGIILVLGLIAFAIMMPETRGMTLREASARFQRIHDVMAY